MCAFTEVVAKITRISARKYNWFVCSEIDEETKMGEVS